MDNQTGATPVEEPKVVVQPSQSDAGNGANQVVIPSSEEVSTPTEKPTQRNLDAERGKMSALEKERNEYSKQLKEERQRREEYEKKAKLLETINEDFAGDPETYEKWRKVRTKRTGSDPGSYESLYGAPPSANVESGKGNQGVYIDPNNLNQTVAQIVDANKGWDEFKAKFPELDPRNLKSEGELSKAKQTYTEIEGIAIALRKARPQMTSGEALIKANLILNQDKALQEAKKEGEAMGRQEVYAQGMGSMGYIQGGQSEKGSEIVVNLSRDQQREYDKLKSQSPKLAERYAREIAKSKES